MSNSNWNILKNMGSFLFPGTHKPFSFGRFIPGRRDNNVPEILEDIIIDVPTMYTVPIRCRNLTITSTGSLTTVPGIPIIIYATGVVEINGVINADSCGWMSYSEADAINNNFYTTIPGVVGDIIYTGLGYASGGTTSPGSSNSKDKARRTGGGAPNLGLPSENRTMLGLASAVGGDIQLPYGRGYAGSNGGGGAAGDDGYPGFGGGSGAGGGGGATGNGSYMTPIGGNGSTADYATNIALFQNNQLEEIPWFGGAGGGGSIAGGNGGGNIQIYASTIIVNALISCKGGNGTHYNNQGMGGGGGGCIMMSYDMLMLNDSSLLNVDGGAASCGIIPYITSGAGGAGLKLLLQR